MIFQKTQTKAQDDAEMREVMEKSERAKSSDDVDTVVGPSVNVEGDFASEGNIIVKGTVSGSVHTSKHLLVEPGAKINANVRAGSAQIAGEIKGNIKIKGLLEFTSTARVVGDIEAQTLVLEAGALLLGKVSMPGLAAENKADTRVLRPAKPLPRRGDESPLDKIEM